MTKKSQHRADGGRSRDRTAEAAQPQGDRVETIRPTLKLSELQDTSEQSRSNSGLNETSAAYQRALDRVRANLHPPAIEQLTKQVQVAQQAYQKLVNDSGLSKTIAAQQKMADQVRAGLALSEAERLAKRAGEAAGINSRHFAELQSAKDLARAAASAMPAPGHRSSASPRPQVEPADNDPSTTITSARDLGRLVRQARKRRKLSQQAFADLVGVGRRFISELEKGKPTLEIGKVLQVAAATGINVLARHRR